MKPMYGHTLLQVRSCTRIIMDKNQPHSFSSRPKVSYLVLSVGHPDHDLFEVLTKVWLGLSMARAQAGVGNATSNEIR